MLQFSAELLSMSGEAALLVRNDCVSYANPAALTILGGDCLGRNICELFDIEPEELQQESFITQCSIDREDYILRCSSEGDSKAIFLSPANDRWGLVSEAFVYALRSSIMSIQTQYETMSKQPHTVELERNMAAINHHCQRINRVISNMDIIRGVTEGDRGIRPVETDAAILIRDLADSAACFCRRAKIDYSGPDSAIIKCDPKMVELMLLNLFSNCIRHAHGFSRIRLRLSEEKNRVIIAVDDDGCGIAPERLHGVFDRYRHGFKLDDIDKGAGLGLTAARCIAKLHGGTILLESRQGIGTAVRVSLSKEPEESKELDITTMPFQQEINTIVTGLADCLTLDELMKIPEE